MRLSVILPITVLCLCGGLLTVARSGAAPVESVARARNGMELLQQYPCHRAETKVVLIKGKEDNFSPDGHEPNFLRPGRDNLRTQSAVTGGSYDQVQADRSFTDSLLLPAGIANGLFVVGLKAVASNETDTFVLGDLEATTGRQRYSDKVIALGDDDAWVVDGTLHSAELGQLPSVKLNPDDPPGTLLEALGGRADPSWLDVAIQDDTSVDFIGLAACVTPPGGRGLTLTVLPAADGAPGVISLSCNFSADNAPICNPLTGDTPCAASLPVACVRPGDTPVPHFGRFTWDRWNWTGGNIALSEPVAATGFASIADVDRFCARRMGTDWRAASIHDGGRAIGISGHGTASTRATRAWVDIADQPYATCWAR